MPLVAQTMARRLGKQEEHRRHRQCDQGKLPIDLGRNVDHPDNGEGRGNKGSYSVDGDELDRRSVVLNAVRGVSGASRIVVRERQPLQVAQELGTEVQDELLTGVGLQQPASKRL